MKTPRLSLFLSVLVGLSALTSLLHADAPKGKKLYAMVVSERADLGPKEKAPESVAPFSYVAIDGGFIEAGDPVAGEKPPTSAQVAEAVRDGLAAAHHTAATSEPALALVYNWGVIRRDTYQIAPTNDVTPNHRARLNLVAPRRTVDRVADDIVNRRYRMPTYLTMEERDAITYAQDDRYFVVVAAYDYAALLRGESVLRWRTRLSAATNSGSMDAVVPALIRNGAGFLGRQLDNAQTEIWRVGASSASTAEDSAASGQALISALNQETLREILFNEHVAAAGENAARARQKNAAIAPSRAALSPELSARIATYQKQKATLQEALSTRIRAQQPGGDTQRAIEAFNAEHAREIAELNRSRDSIRDELARLSVQSGSTDKSLEALQREFSASVQTLTAASARP